MTSDTNCLTLRCKVPLSLSTLNHSLRPGPRCCNGPGTGLKRNEPAAAAALQSSSSYQQLRELSNTDVITMIKNTFFNTTGHNSFSMYVKILDTARRWNFQKYMT